MRLSTVTRHAAPMGQCTGPHLSVGSIYYNAEVYPYSVWRAPPERGGAVPPERGSLPSVQWALHPSGEKVYPVCSGPFMPPERGSLPGVQWALHPS